MLVAACASTETPPTEGCASDDECATSEICIDSACRPRLDIEQSDAGPDVVPDIQPDVPEPPSIAPARAWRSDIPLITRDIAALGDGHVIVGTTSNDFEADEGREAVAIAFDSNGALRWATRLGDQGNDQLTSVTSDGEFIIAAGVTRQLSGDDPANDDILITEIQPEGTASVWTVGRTGRHEVAWDIRPGNASTAAWVLAGRERFEGQNDGLLVGLNRDLSFSFALLLDTGVDEVLRNVVVSGEWVLASGSRDAELWVVGYHVMSGEVWSVSAPTTTGGSRCLEVAPDGTIWVCGSDETGAALLPLDADGTPRSSRLMDDVGSDLRGLVISETSAYGIGERGGEVFVSLIEDERVTFGKIADVGTVGTKAPIHIGESGGLVVAHDQGASLITWIPFGLDAAVACSDAFAVPPDSAATPLRSLDVTVTSRRLRVQRIEGVRTVPLVLEENAPLCDP